MDSGAFGNHPMVRGLSEAMRETLRPCAREVRFEPGRLIFRQGQPADTLYLLLEGRVALEQHIPGRGTLQVEGLHGGDILGLSWMFPDAPWTLDARTVEAVRAIALEASCLRRVMAEQPAVGMPVATYLNGRLYERLQRVRLQRLDVYRTER